MYNTIKLGVSELDTFFSELKGIVPSQVMLFTGEPGVGKTTLCMFILSKLAQKRDINPPAFLSLEMSDFQLKMQTRKIQGLEPVMISTKMEDIDAMLVDLALMKPSVVVVDSLQKWAGQSNSKQLECTEKFYKFAKETFIPVILIGHVGKDGKYKGPSSILHEVDTHIHMGYDDANEKYIGMGKTRFGGVANSIYFGIEDFGLRIGTRYYTKDGEKSIEDVLESPDELGAVKDFKTGVYDPEKFKTAGRELFNYLKKKYHSELLSKSPAKPENIQIDFKNVKHTYCKSDSTKIQIGMKMLDNWVPGVRSIYRQEDKYMDKWCKTHQHNAIWVLIHEFTHLFKDMKHHKGSFFAKVDRIANDNKWLFV